MTRSRPIASPEPVYPIEARNAGLEATVLVWLVVTEEGKPADIRIKRSAGHSFDQAAYECVKKWAFAPATYEGKPIPTIEEIEMNFRLH
ncbi:MAG: energy transducer TonB [Candidatus Korobacteraceae bacterium]